MKHLGVAALLVVASGGASLAAAQSLGDVARQEAERRKAITAPGKLFTNETLQPAPAPSAPPAPPAAAVVPPSGQAEQQVPADGRPAAADQPGDAAAVPPAYAPRDEASWRKRVTTARDNLARAQSFAEALQARIDLLSADFVNRDDPAQRSVVAADRDRALAELGRVQQEIADHEKAIVAIQDEARRAGVPAGWVR